MYGYFITEPRSKVQLKCFMRDLRRGQKIENLGAGLLNIFTLEGQFVRM